VIDIGVYIDAYSCGCDDSPSERSSSSAVNESQGIKPGFSSDRMEPKLLP